MNREALLDFALSRADIGNEKNVLRADTEIREFLLNNCEISINKENFNSVKNEEKTVLLDFYAEWCGPCRTVLPIVDEIAAERDDIVVGKINVDSEQELARDFGILSIPTLIVLKNGKIVNKASGARPKAQILALLNG